MSDCRSQGSKFDSLVVHMVFMESDSEIFSMVTVSLPMVQEEY